MLAFYSGNVGDFVETPPEFITGKLSAETIRRFTGDHTRQLDAWTSQITLLQRSLMAAISRHASSRKWGILFEYPLLRIQRRLDVVILAGNCVLVLEFKVGSKTFAYADRRQVQTYALDLRDFHERSHSAVIVPVLCATQARSQYVFAPLTSGVADVVLCNSDDLAIFLDDICNIEAIAGEQIPYAEWQAARYHPVPSIIEAAQLLYAGHTVAEIAHSASAPKNLGISTERIIHIIQECRAQNHHAVVFLTGVPGSGKTLVGLNAVHDVRFTEQGQSPGAYLSGNTPLVRVLREALAKDKTIRDGCTIDEARRIVSSEIQGLMDFLRQYLDVHIDEPPIDHVIVFDEAQRAWDAETGARKFNRQKSEAALFLDIMWRHQDWAVIIALVGGGQEINRGELGISEWGRAIAAAGRDGHHWVVYAPPEVLVGDDATAWQRLFKGPQPCQVKTEPDLHLQASVRAYQSIGLSQWVNHTLDGDSQSALLVSRDSPEFPVVLTRSLASTKAWLRAQTRGNRRCGLVATSGAKRLRAEGLGASLGASQLDEIAHWFLKPDGDIRSSNTLEVAANEYGCQGLELDYVGVCWDGDLVWDVEKKSWISRSLAGNTWHQIASPAKQKWIVNKYRVLLTRARLGTIIWVPSGDHGDHTRPPSIYDAIANMLVRSGARPVG